VTSHKGGNLTVPGEGSGGIVFMFMVSAYTFTYENLNTMYHMFKDCTLKFSHHYQSKVEKGHNLTKMHTNYYSEQVYKV
jgi:hypothetical protein